MARIIRVADAYDAMTSARPYRQAFTRRSKDELKRCVAGNLTPVVEAFLRIRERKW